MDDTRDAAIFYNAFMKFNPVLNDLAHKQNNSTSIFNSKSIYKEKILILNLKILIKYKLE